MQDVNYKRMEEQIRSKYEGVENAHKTGILEKGLKYKPVVGNMKDLEYINGIKLSREDICAVHGVPPILVGILDNSSYANYETALKAFFMLCIIPKVKRINAVITTVAKRFDKNIFFEFDLTNEDALKEDEERKSRIATAHFNMGVPFNRINQRLNLGYDDVEGGDVGFLPFNLQPATMAADPPDPEPAPAEPDDDDDDDNKSIKSKIIYNKEKKLALWKQFDRTTSIIEKRYMKMIEVYFLGLEMGILRRLESGKSVKDCIKQLYGKRSGQPTFKEINVDVYLFNEAEEIESWNKQSTKIHKLSMKTNGDRELINLGLAGNFDMSNPIVVKYLDEYGLEKATEVIGSNADDVRKTLIIGVENGDSIPQLKKRIQAVYNPYTDQGYKATRIARTEVIGTSNRGALEAYRQSGVKGIKKAWLNEPDARDTHFQAGIQYSEDNAILIDKDFHVGGGRGEAPGNIGLAEEDCNCRCSIIPVVE